MLRTLFPFLPMAKDLDVAVPGPVEVISETYPYIILAIVVIIAVIVILVSRKRRK